MMSLPIILPKMNVPMGVVLILGIISLCSLAGVSSTRCNYEPTESSLDCQIRVLQNVAQLEVEEVFLGQTEKRIDHLNVKCSDIFFSESEVGPELFKGEMNRNLESLTIHYCKIKDIPSNTFVHLQSLRRLAIQSHNEEWDGSIMEVEPHALRALASLEQLDLSFNNIWTLPNGLICDLAHLELANFSHNHLVEVSDLGLSPIHSCQTGLTTLDLSSNAIAALRDSDLKLASKLVVLNLGQNRLTILGDKALAPLTALEEISLADNQLAALPPTIFNQSQALKRLFLQNNSLSLLPGGVFEGLSSLIVLNLSRNAIANHLLAADTFSGLRNLEVLDLSWNQITQIDRETFHSHLPRLRRLLLEHNQIHSVDASSFGHQPLLQVLVLSHNKIESLAEDAFRGLEQNLTSLSLNHNELVKVPDSIFRLTPQLEDLSLDNNHLIEVPSSIGHLKRLKTLDLGENAITELQEGDFNAMESLYGLRLAGNRLTRIPSNFFANASQLHVLNLARNQLSQIEQKAFDHLQELRALRLDNNQLTDINGVLSSLSHLQWFNLSSNQLAWFDFAFIPKSLEMLDLHDNRMEELGNYYKLKSGFNIKTLDASANRIKKLSKLSLPASLETIILNENQIETIPIKLFEDKPNLARVDLRANAISHLTLDSLFISKVPIKAHPQFLLSGNPFSCDCEMEWLQQINEIALNGNHPQVTDLDAITCQLPNNGGQNVSSMTSSSSASAPIPISELAQDDFLCPYKTHCFPQCMCCDFFACDCRMQCPEGCTCFHDSDWSVNRIQCSNRNHTDVPLLIPMDATQIHLDGNQLGDVDTQSFIGRRRVTALYMNASKITSISQETLGGLANLEVLHLEDNQLKELIGHEFETLSGLKELYLQNNDLIHIGESVFGLLTSLTTLRLDGNLLTSFPVWDLMGTHRHPFLISLSLGENMWSCECEFLTPFITFLRTFGEHITDADAINCVTNELTVESLHNKKNQLSLCSTATGSASVDKDQTSKEQQALLKLDEAVNPSFLPILIGTIVALVVVVVVVCLLVCLFRVKIQTWLYNKTSEIYDSRSGSSIHSVGSCYAQNKLFDVYISYSIKDADFVDQNLAPTLEHGATSYKLCLHQRDFPPSASLYDTVSVATESSSRVLLVLSRSYLDTEWPHVKIPLRNALSKESSKLIILFLEDISEDELSSYQELRQYLENCTSVKWGSPGFLNKLRFFLPEPAFLTFHRNVTLRTLQPASPVQHAGLGGPSSGSVGHIKSNSLVQVDQVSGVWTYAINNSPVGSVATQSTTADGFPASKYLSASGHHPMAVAATTQSGAPLRNAPSVVSSVYSHHTYQSIPESHHIYHTLEPSLLPMAGDFREDKGHPHLRPKRTSGSRHMRVNEPLNAVYINRNLDLVLKSPPTPSPSSSIGEESSTFRRSEDSNSPKTTTPSSSPHSSTSCASSVASSAEEELCHHAHTHSTLSGQQLLPSHTSSSSAQNEDEYIV
eukprot:maker-scaffold23_size669530-snap-gene-4.7 protein:Tk11072 transcript:maker-scaffold23_size669530-snap-gene-4.7-mRNA-1 annotation:"slit homolog 2"